MNIAPIIPNFSEPSVGKVAGKSSTDTSTNYTGPSFLSNMQNIAKAAALTVAGGNNAAQLGLNRQKEEKTDELFSFTEAEKEQADEYISRIEELIGQLSRDK